MPKIVRSARTGRVREVQMPGARVSVRTQAVSVPPGARVRVPFGGRDAEGIVTRRSITGRYTVKVDVNGASEPATASYAANDIRIV